MTAFLTGFALDQFFRNLREVKLKKVLESHSITLQGGYAQRDIIDWTLAEAAARAGLRDVALALAHERLGSRPESEPNRRFLRQAEAIAA